jgi:hypothetical protein
MQVVKSTGYDWVITYQYDDEPVYEMSVYGQMKIEDAIREARDSFDDEDQPLLVIFKVEREPMPQVCRDWEA